MYYNRHYTAVYKEVSVWNLKIIITILLYTAVNTDIQLILTLTDF